MFSDQVAVGEPVVDRSRNLLLHIERSTACTAAGSTCTRRRSTVAAAVVAAGSTEADRGEQPLRACPGLERQLGSSRLRPTLRLSWSGRARYRLDFPCPTSTWQFVRRFVFRAPPRSRYRPTPCCQI